MAHHTVIHGYRLPSGIADDGLVAQWAAERGPVNLRDLDRGDDLDPAGTTTRANDQQLDRIEILQGILTQYAALTRHAVRAGVAGQWAAWEAALARKDRLAATIRALGWEPAFHIGDRAYQRRMIALLQRTPPRDEQTLQQLYLEAQSSWQEGGLCLGYPPEAVRGPLLETMHDPREYTAEEAVAACKHNTFDRWGDCTETSLKILAFLASAEVFFPAEGPTRIGWTAVRDIFRMVAGVPWLGGHVFVYRRTAAGTVAFDPSEIGFDEPAPAKYQSFDPWRGAMETYHAGLGLRALDAGDRATAETAARATIALDARLSHGFILLGDLRADEGKWAEAAAAYTQAFQRDPQGSVERHRMATLAMHDHQWARAESLYRTLVSDFPHIMHYWTGLGNARLAQSHWAAAETAFRRARDIDPAHPSALAGLGRALLEQGKDREAEAMLRAAITNHHATASTRAHLGTILTKQGRYAPAKYQLELAIALDPDAAYAHFRLGQYYMEVKLWTRAEIALRRAYALYPHDLETQSLLEMVFEVQGKHAEAAHIKSVRGPL